MCIAWIDGTAVVLGVSEDLIRASGKREDAHAPFNSTVRLDEANGGGYMATLEVFHQIHCLVASLLSPFSCRQADTGSERVA